MADPQDTDPNDRDPRDEGMRRRSGNPNLSVWLILAILLLLGAIVYVVMAVFGGG